MSESLFYPDADFADDADRVDETGSLFVVLSAFSAQSVSRHNDGEIRVIRVYSATPI
jgi:hypothetical protein